MFIAIVHAAINHHPAVPAKRPVTSLTVTYGIITKRNGRFSAVMAKLYLVPPAANCD
jgi:hypothetical protein